MKSKFLAVAATAMILSASALAADKPKVAFIPQLIGIPYFNAMEDGGKKAGEALGVDFIYQGPVDTNPVDQLQILNNLVDQGVQAIAISVLDASSLEPVVASAKAKGVSIFTSDSDAPDSGRPVYVAQAADDGLGFTIIDEMVKRVGEDAKIGIVSGEATATNLNTWIKFMQQRVKEKYPEGHAARAQIRRRHRPARRRPRHRADDRQSRSQGHHRRRLDDLPRRRAGDRDRRQDRQGGRHRLLQPEYGAGLPQERRHGLHGPVGSRRARLPDRLGRQAAHRQEAVRSREHRARASTVRSASMPRPASFSSGRPRCSPPTTSTSSISERLSPFSCAMERPRGLSMVILAG